MEPTVSVIHDFQDSVPFKRRQQECEIRDSNLWPLNRLYRLQLGFKIADVVYSEIQNVCLRLFSIKNLL
jgi:hypothetical protein